MIVKILSSSSSDFHGVKYNEKKIDKGSGELMKMKNFPSFINSKSSQDSVRDYLKSISKNEKIKKPQFHAVISTKFQEHSKEDLTKIAESFMDDMGYGKQPYIVVFHNDTDNNHVHLVSTRVSKETGKKINDSYEKLKAQKALSKTLENLYGENLEANLEKLLRYKISTQGQLKTLLERNGYKILQNKNDENALDILKNGVKQKTIYGNQIVYDNSKKDNRLKQIVAILNKYKEIYSGKVFKIEDDRELRGKMAKDKYEVLKNDSKVKIEYESELQKKLRDVFGIDIVFHHKEDKDPYGYTLIDHKSSKVYKGSELLKMAELFEFTSDTIDKKNFELLKDYNVPDPESKKVLLEFFNTEKSKFEIKDFMLFQNKVRKDIEAYKEVRSDVKDFVKNWRSEKYKNNDVTIIKNEDGKYYALHTKHHYISELETLIGEREYEKFISPQSMLPENNNEAIAQEILKATEEIMEDLMKSSTTAKDPREDELRKKRKKKSR
ncbi:relaxase/mobilization nuclease domain-containing protein [Elizabethkingia anophelis]|uniref:Relaxase n=2 Tax=Elizabethkingia anophelis TaxID=1117645 RepID=A0A455ZG01_9FLAO|nr:relaxase/mobilization nuclease domain-containing protein [Elizabethkingia anophelis]AIL44387.1 Putative conjugative transposon mobilization protein [Elizabethkingia anophelis NUHP1]DAC75767.1 TPA_exp: relaxase [Elizabethkingia anophelis]DAC75837.1 TPA_exp: relaxase [Elizabethkingia anophelis]